MNGLRKKSKDTLKQMKIKHSNPTSMGQSESSPRVHCIQANLKKQEKSQISNLTLLIKEFNEEQQTELRVSRRKK